MLTSPKYISLSTPGFDTDYLVDVMGVLTRVGTERELDKKWKNNLVESHLTRVGTEELEKKWKNDQVESHLSRSLWGSNRMHSI